MNPSAGNMSKLNSQDTVSMQPVMTSNSSCAKIIKYPLTVTATSSVAAATMLTLSFTAHATSSNAAFAPALDSTSTPAPSHDAVAAGSAAEINFESIYSDQILRRRHHQSPQKQQRCERTLARL